MTELDRVNADLAAADLYLVPLGCESIDDAVAGPFKNGTSIEVKDWSGTAEMIAVIDGRVVLTTLIGPIGPGITFVPTKIRESN